MRLSPLDIKKQEFNRGFRGFEEEEVSAFLQMLADQWDEVLEENRKLESRVSELENKLQHYQRVEDALQEALNTAKSSSKTKLANAEQEASLLLREAQAKGEEIIQKAKYANQQLKQSNISLDQRQQQILARLKAFLSAELDMLGRFDDQVSDVEPVKNTPTPPYGNGVAPVVPIAAANPVQESTDIPDVVDNNDNNSGYDQRDSLLESVSGFPQEGEEIANDQGDEDYESFDNGTDAGYDYDASPESSDATPSFSDETAQPHEDRPPLRDNVSPADMDKIRRILDDLD